VQWLLMLQVSKHSACLLIHCVRFALWLLQIELAHLFASSYNSLWVTASSILWLSCCVSAVSWIHFILNYRTVLFKCLAVINFSSWWVNQRGKHSPFKKKWDILAQISAPREPFAALATGLGSALLKQEQHKKVLHIRWQDLWSQENCVCVWWSCVNKVQPSMSNLWHTNDRKGCTPPWGCELNIS
jgi:hypothetical protein